jgi:hypothetical protein
MTKNLDVGQSKQKFSRQLLFLSNFSEFGHLTMMIHGTLRVGGTMGDVMRQLGTIFCLLQPGSAIYVSVIVVCL